MTVEFSFMTLLERSREIPRQSRSSGVRCDSVADETLITQLSGFWKSVDQL